MKMIIVNGNKMLYRNEIQLVERVCVRKRFYALRRVVCCIYLLINFLLRVIKLKYIFYITELV